MPIVTIVTIEIIEIYYSLSFYVPMKKSLLLLLTSLLFCSGWETSVKADDAKPWTFWYWMNGAVTREGITADLEAMAEIGLEGCYLNQTSRFKLIIICFVYLK